MQPCECYTLSHINAYFIFSGYLSKQREKWERERYAHSMDGSGSGRTQSQASRGLHALPEAGVLTAKLSVHLIAF